MRIHINMYQLKTYFLDLITNRVLLCAIIAWMTAQIIKVFTTSIYRKEFSLRQQRGNAQFSFGCGDGHGHFLRIALRI